MSQKIRPNSPCPCGSGKKYKRCCGTKSAAYNSSYPEKEQTKEPCTISLSALPKIPIGELTALRLQRNIELIKSFAKPSNEDITQTIDDLESIFQKYDKIQLLGALGLHLLYIEVIRSHDLIDEEIEPILEYAMSFAFSCHNNSTLTPPEDVVKSMYTKLLYLKRCYNDAELLSSLNNESSRDLLNHIAFINVRGDGYPQFVEEVFDEYFLQHEAFISLHYNGATLSDIHILLQHIEKRIICRLQDSSARGVIGAYNLWEQWKEWADEHEDDFMVNIPEGMNPIMGGFLRDNPEIPRTSDGYPLLFNYQDYEKSSSIFEIIPNNEKEKALLDSWSCSFGDNDGFMQGKFRGSILNYASIVRQKPFLKYNKKFYCFSVLLPHRRMFELTSNLLKVDNPYYENHHLGNAYPKCRDNFTERKVFDLFSKAFSKIRFYQSVHYQGIDGEMDILGVSDQAIYLIEVKAYQLTDNYRGGTIGIENKLKESVGKASSQCQRSKEYIQSATNAVFSCAGCAYIEVDKALPTFKICVTLEHYGGLTCNMKGLVDMKVIEANQRDIWIVSLYDLMAVLDNIDNESKFIKYLITHNQITTGDDVVYNDEMNLLGIFLNDPEMLSTRPLMLMSGSEAIDSKYQNSLYKRKI